MGSFCLFPWWQSSGHQSNLSAAARAMLRHCRTSGGHTMINAAKVAFLPQPRTLASTTTSHPFHSPPSTNVRFFRPLCSMTTNYDPQLEKLFEEKRYLRSKIRGELKKMDPIQRSQEGFVSRFFFSFFKLLFL